MLFVLFAFCTFESLEAIEKSLDKRLRYRVSQQLYEAGVGVLSSLGQYHDITAKKALINLEHIKRFPAFLSKDLKELLFTIEWKMRNGDTNFEVEYVALGTHLNLIKKFLTENKDDPEYTGMPTEEEALQYSNYK